MAKTLPYKSIQVQGYKYNIKEVAPSHPMLWELNNGEDNEEIIFRYYGRLDPDNFTIYINKDVAYARKKETLLHEITHIIVKSFGEWDITDEQNLQIFVTALYDTIIRNRIRLI